MLVTKSRLHCVKYKLEFDKQMEEMDLPYRSLVGFSGTVHDQDTHQDYTESSMNGVPETQTEESLKEPQFRILIVNNKFQTGFDEPMLHTMYVDKKFGGLQCVQTLSRLNRTMRGKTDTFVLDFVNDPQDVQESFQPFYEGTILEEETDPNRLYSIKDYIDE
jgi:type I restriction enzyme R subunit